MLKYLKYGIEKKKKKKKEKKKKKKKRYQSRISHKSAATQLKYLPDP